MRDERAGGEEAAEGGSCDLWAVMILGHGHVGGRRYAGRPGARFFDTSASAR